jgi:hypothetical protein
MTKYSDAYLESLFENWYARGGPEYKVFVREGCPADEYGRTPHHTQISVWASDYRWQERKEALNARALELAEENLIENQVQMWKRHADFAQQVGKTAYDYILEHGFDSSASAIQALKWAQEEERITRGADAFYKSVKNKSNDELLAMVRGLAERQLSAEDIIDADTNTDGDAEPSN